MTPLVPKNVTNFVPCPQCGQHWYITSASPRGVYFRECRSCGEKGRTNRAGERTEPHRAKPVPCPKCGGTWHLRGASNENRFSRACKQCGHSAVTDREGNELVKHVYGYACLDCGTKTVFKYSGRGFAHHTCPACEKRFVRAYNSPELRPHAEWEAERAQAPRQARTYSPRVYSPEVVAARALKKLEKEQAKAEKAAQRKAAKPKAAAKPARVTYDTLPKAPAVVATRAARRRLEDLHEERRLIGDDPLFATA